MWNPKTELVKRAAEIAKKDYPDGFNKEQLIKSSHKVFGGYATDKFKSVRTFEDVGNKLNEMALIDGGYPLSMTSCEVVGISGDCGIDCPVFRNGTCDEVGDHLETVRFSSELSENDKDEILDLYGE